MNLRMMMVYFMKLKVRLDWGTVQKQKEEQH